MNTEQCRQSFISRLQDEERSTATVKKYRHSVTQFFDFLTGAKTKSEIDRLDLTNSDVIRFKEHLKEQYAPATVNATLVAVNRFLAHIGRADLRVHLLRAPRRIFRDDTKELTRNEYIRLLKAARSRRDDRLQLLMETICSTGIRVSELQYITVESLASGSTEIDNKGRVRTVWLDRGLVKALRKYCARRQIKHGPVFQTKSGRPLDRSNIWKLMKQLAESAKVAAEKIFPHNLRHLFAVTFYKETNDVVRLADLLGHANIDTTRIYTSVSIGHHRDQLARMKLRLCA